ncbi:hypothetical protein [Clostridium butyricum]|uniref:hypothetical protein n=1 Tax=Clostridium butyricum TaxID=1492 RepID=UPI0018ABC6F0|nr:hypothetical protein [Clostridium butyricum]
MLNEFCNISIDRDLTDDILKSLNDLSKKTICIGVPDSTEHENSKITNAELMYVHTNGARNRDMIKSMQHDIDSGMPYSEAHELYVHENGSPLWNIPPRPILEPAMDNGKEQMADLMKDVAIDALEGKNIQTGLDNVGMQGQNIARDWFTNPANNWAANSEDTVKKKGSDRPLIDTSELRKSITYVVKDGE